MTLEDLYRLLRSGHVQAQGVMDTLDDPLIVLDQGLSVATANPAFLRTFQTDRDQTVGYGLFALGNGQWDIPELRRLLEEVIPKATAIVDYEVSHEFPHIGYHTFLVTARRLAHPDNTSQQILVVFTDVTKRRRSDAAKDLLLNETRHRMKNLVGVIRAIATQTRTEDLSAAEYQNAFLGRLDGLIATQDFILGEVQAVDLETLVRRGLDPYRDQVRLEPGPHLRLEKRQVQPLGMILHELATNANKYGSLSVPEGTVRVTWSIDRDGEQSELSMLWEEAGGPAVSRPHHTGFGTTLIERSTAVELKGEADVSYEPGGVRVTVRIPISVPDNDAG